MPELSQHTDASPCRPLNTALLIASAMLGARTGDQRAQLDDSHLLSTCV